MGRPNPNLPPQPPTRRRRLLLPLLLLAAALTASSVVWFVRGAEADSNSTEVRLAGLAKPVDILRDRWGVPHIYAASTADLFFAQGYIAARDRLFQIDLWRRAGNGEVSEVLGPGAIERDRLARSVRYRGDLAAEWSSYGPDTREIAVAFTNGINAYIRSLNGKRPREFAIAGFDPAPWKPEDCLGRIAGLAMVQNPVREIRRVLDLKAVGMQMLTRYLKPDPPVALTVPNGLVLDDIGPAVLGGVQQAVSEVEFAGSNNWVVDGTMTASGKPLLANDPHRPIQIPSLRKTVHLVAPGWNVIGAGEPGLPGIALGHNDRIAFGFTIVGTDQADLYVETTDPANPNRYRHRGEWREMEVERQSIKVKGEAPRPIELRYTVHGAVIHADKARHRAYVLRWVGTEPGTAGYLAALSLSRARNWTEFRGAVERYKVPSENLVYADIDGNIGWHASGLTPIRKNWAGLYPVPGDGEYEWAGFYPMKDLPHIYNPKEHFVSTANHNILPPKFPFPISYEWDLGFRQERILELLRAPGKKFTVTDFEQMQLDVVSVPARRLQAIVRKSGWRPKPGTIEADAVNRLLAWDARMLAESPEALIYSVWLAFLQRDAIEPRQVSVRVGLRTLLETMEANPPVRALETSLESALQLCVKTFGRDIGAWKWGAIHQAPFDHALGEREFRRGPIPRPGEAHTINSTSGVNFQQNNGASYRQVVDLADWDRSTMTNVPGESGDPDSPHYADLLQPWAEGKFHPMPFSKRAVEAATVQRLRLVPAR